MISAPYHPVVLLLSAVVLIGGRPPMQPVLPLVESCQIILPKRESTLLLHGMNQGVVSFVYHSRDNYHYILLFLND